MPAADSLLAELMKTSAPSPARLDLAADLRLVVARLGRQLRQQSAGGLTPSQLSILATVDRDGAMHMGELARRESVAPPTITRIVAALVDAGLVTRTANPDDARSAVIQITAKGRRVLDALRKERTVLLVERLAALDDDEVALLTEALPLLERLVTPE